VTAFEKTWNLLKDYDSDVFERLPEELHQFNTQSYPQALYEKRIRTNNPQRQAMLERFADRGYNEIIMKPFREGKDYFGHQFTPEQIDKIIEYDKKYEPYSRNKDKMESLITFHGDGEGGFESWTHRLGAGQEQCRNAPGKKHPPHLTPEGLEWSWERPPNDEFVDDDGKTYKIAPGTHSGPWHPITGRRRDATKGERWEDVTRTNRHGETYTEREEIREPGSTYNFSDDNMYYPRVTSEEHPDVEVCERCRISEDGRKEYCPDSFKPYRSMMNDLRSDRGDVWDEERYGILPFYGDRLALTSPHQGGPYGFIEQSPIGDNVMADRDFVNRTSRYRPELSVRDNVWGTEDIPSLQHDVVCPSCRGMRFAGQEGIGMWNPSFAGNPNQWFGVFNPQNQQSGRVEMKIDPLRMLPILDNTLMDMDRVTPSCSNCGRKTRFALDSSSGDSAIRNNQFMRLRHFDDLDAIADWKGMDRDKSIHDMENAEALEFVSGLGEEAWDGINFDEDDV